MTSPTHTPRCVGIIMDGNRRWARAQGLPQIEGHRKGYHKLKELITWCREEHVSDLVVYALSTENLQREAHEVSYLFDLFRELGGELEKIKGKEVAIHFIGDTTRFPEDLQGIIEEAEKKNHTHPMYRVWIAAPYGGRAEITAAVNTLVREGKGPYTEDDVARALWSAGMPDPDLIIRTGGDKRLSNFLPWQSAYTELFFVDTYWPDFSHELFSSILARFNERERRYGA